MCSSAIYEVRLRCVYGLHKWGVCVHIALLLMSFTHTHTHRCKGVLMFFTCWPHNLISARVWGHSVNAAHAYSSCLHPCTRFAVVKVTSPLLIHCDKVTLSLAAFICLSLPFFFFFVCSFLSVFKGLFFLLVYKYCSFSELKSTERKKENCHHHHSPPCSSKPVWLTLLHEAQIKKLWRMFVQPFPVQCEKGWRMSASKKKHYNNIVNVDHLTNVMYSKAVW